MKELKTKIYQSLELIKKVKLKILSLEQQLELWKKELSSLETITRVDIDHFKKLSKDPIKELPDEKK